MKKLYLFLLFGGLLLSSGCSKDSDNGLFPGASMNCRINDEGWTAITRISTRQGNNFIINGTSLLGNDFLNITIFGTTPGTYVINPITATVQASATYTSKVSVTDSLYTAFSGTFTLTSVDSVSKKISGNFSFKARNLSLVGKTITEGTFTNLSYQ